ncbi:hypothetical protein KM043_010212 [Ampulex compressa]|nr:hypothetical protein KM043_010212 [Ampulex compressa]
MAATIREEGKFTLVRRDDDLVATGNKTMGQARRLAGPRAASKGRTLGAARYEGGRKSRRQTARDLGPQMTLDEAIIKLAVVSHRRVATSSDSKWTNQWRVDETKFKLV